MSKFWFFDDVLDKDIFIESKTVSEAFMKSIEMVLDGRAKHPVYIGMAKSEAEG